jgi:RNA polymerase sigma factor (sigma-70 family)
MLLTSSPPFVDTAEDADERLAQLFLEHLPVIDAAIRGVASRYGLGPDERQDFASRVHLKLIEHHYEILRRFEHRSSLVSYLRTVVQRLFLDSRNSDWGKWRPSATARRAGPVAIRLERLILRDGLTFDEAVGVMQTNELCPLSREAMCLLYQSLPRRTTRRPSGDQVPDEVLAQIESAEAALVAREQAHAARRAHQALEEALLTLSPQDQLIIRFHYVDGLSFADIARLMHLKARPLYRRVGELRGMLRSMLAARGITVADILGGDLDVRDDTEEP